MITRYETRPVPASDVLPEDRIVRPTLTGGVHVSKVHRVRVLLDGMIRFQYDSIPNGESEDYLPEQYVEVIQ